MNRTCSNNCKYWRERETESSDGDCRNKYVNAVITAIEAYDCQFDLDTELKEVLKTEERSLFEAPEMLPFSLYNGDCFGYEKK